MNTTELQARVQALLPLYESTKTVRVCSHRRHPGPSISAEGVLKRAQLFRCEAEVVHVLRVTRATSRHGTLGPASRNLAIYLLRRTTRLSTVTIGRLFLTDDGETRRVEKLIERRMEASPEYRAKVERALERCA